MPNTNIVEINGKRFALLKAHLSRGDNNFSTDSVAGMVMNLSDAITISSVGKEMVESGRPYVRIHAYHSGQHEFRVEVGCYTREAIAEWYIPAISPEETRIRLKNVDAIPWDEIRGGLHWRAELNCESKYWKFLEQEILNSPRSEFHRDAQAARSEKIESMINPHFSIGEDPMKADIAQMVNRYFAQKQGKSGELQEAKKDEMDQLELAARRCHVEIRAGEFKGQDGFYSRYFRGDDDLCIFFSPNSARGKADCGIERRLDGKKMRIPWKDITSGKPFAFEGILTDYALDRFEGGYFKNVLYLNVELFDRKYFNPAVAFGVCEARPVRMSFDKLEQEFDDLQIFLRKADGKLHWRLSAGTSIDRARVSHSQTRPSKNG